MAEENMSPSERMNIQVVRLLSGVSQHSDQHLAEVERDLVQVDTLLSEAIKKLCNSFMAVHQAVDKQQAALAELRSDGLSASEYAQRFEALQAEINQHVSAAVTGLQFQDMTSQLIGRMAEHVAGLRHVFAALDAPSTGRSEDDGEAVLAALNQVSDQVEARIDKLEGGVRSTVNQRHMESGDIELF